MDEQQKQVARDSEAFGRKLALLLAAADVPEETKDGIAALVEEMTPSEIDRLAKALEANVKGAVEAEFANLERRRASRPELLERRRAVDQAASAALDDVEAKLERLEREGGHDL